MSLHPRWLGLVVDRLFPARAPPPVIHMEKGHAPRPDLPLPAVASLSRSERPLPDLLAEARATAFDDAAAVMRNWTGHKAETAEDWLQLSYTFSNEALLIRRRLSTRSTDGEAAR